MRAAVFAAAISTFVSLGVANAATTGVHLGTFSGNEECPQPGGKKLAVAALADSFCIAKFDNADSNAGEQGGDDALDGLSLLNNFTLTGAGGKTGTFSFDDQGEGISITHLILKAGSGKGAGFAIYDLQGATSGDWMTNDLDDKDISHLSFFGQVSTVPLPASLPLFLASLLGFGLVARRRRLTA